MTTDITMVLQTPELLAAMRRRAARLSAEIMRRADHGIEVGDMHVELDTVYDTINEIERNLARGARA